MRWFLPRGTGHDSLLWPVLLLLLIVLVPSAGVVWMMRAAMENERLAGRQRQADAHSSRLSEAKDRVDAACKQRLARLDAIVETTTPSRAFSQVVHDELADSAVIYDDQLRVAYPAPADADSQVDEPATPEWARAHWLEFNDKNLSEAADAYGEIAANATKPLLAARAREARARALFHHGDNAGAIQVLQSLRLTTSATNAAARSLVAAAELRLLELLDADSPERTEVATSLARRLNDYDAVYPANQRLFLMGSLRSLEPDISLPTLDALELAANFLAGQSDVAPRGELRPTTTKGVWQIRSPSGRVIALLNDAELRQSIEQAVGEDGTARSDKVVVLGPAQALQPSADLITQPLSPTLPDWQLAVASPGVGSLDLAARKRTSFFLWTSIAVVAMTAALAAVSANLLRRQSRLARLKNDLVATVSHELKTPLASIRLLVDTLLDEHSTTDAPFGDPQRAREYLEMIARENSRLSRLIDNFLTFSRMERGKHRFEFQPTDAAAIVDQAVAAVADRFDGTKNRLTATIGRPLPLVGDADALITVVVNLLDNAWKYSDEPRNIAVNAHQSDGRVDISVSDNGIGLSPRAARRVFDRFYQVDQHLSRTQGGCGLGLSIVQYIVDAHGGNITVESRPGAGTAFTVTLPATVNHLPQSTRSSQSRTEVV
jgi:signal transduction histidine kinase